MICVIEPARRKVWGVGKTREQAFEKAYEAIEAHKANDPCFMLSSLEVSRLRKGANLKASDMELWAWVKYRAPYFEANYDLRD